MERMQEGLKGHLMVQSAYAPEYRAEVPVKLECEVEGVKLLVQGRVDGMILTKDAVTIEEIKTTRLPPESISDNDYPVHWAQAEIYAHIVCVKNNLPAATVKLVYASLTGSRAVFTRIYTKEKLEALFYMYASVYALRILKADRWKEVSVPAIRECAFPFETYREGQREMAARAYMAIKTKTKALIEAPTGIGKTAAALFPALKALGEGLTDTVFYLTARTTGRKSAENALSLMRKNGIKVRSVTLSAKKKVCRLSEINCDPDVCPYAEGYFDRQKEAIEESWERESWSAEDISALSEKYRLCPFELSLALSETADVIICDYNYVFDPAVRLRRFFDRKGAYTLLIDEAHNLLPRAREMYSETLSGEKIALLRREVGHVRSRKDPLYLALSDLLKAFPECEEPACETALPEKLISAVKEFIEDAKPDLGVHAPFKSALADLFFTANAFIRVSDEFDPETHRTVITREGKRACVRLWCWNVTPRIQKAMKRMRGVILFSATLSPIRHYADLLGLDEDAGDIYFTLPSPFPAENLFCASLGIPTRYRMREESAKRVAKAIYEMWLSRKGNYLACFPSHAYLNSVAEVFRAEYPCVPLLIQSRDMTEAERDGYLSVFDNTDENGVIAFIAMGGVFSEGIDLPGDRLIGAAIVGVGLPQISFENDLLRDLFTEKSGDGFETAYMYPGIGKCLQAAGRVIRTDTDKGVVLFIDDRYRTNVYRSLLLPRYAPAFIKEENLIKALSAFWEENRQA